MYIIYNCSYVMVITPHIFSPFYWLIIVVTNPLSGISKIEPLGISCDLDNEPKKSIFPSVGASKIAQWVIGDACEVHDYSASVNRKATELLKLPLTAVAQFTSFDVIDNLS